MHTEKGLLDKVLSLSKGQKKESGKTASKVKAGVHDMAHASGHDAQRVVRPSSGDPVSSPCVLCALVPQS